MMLAQSGSCYQSPFRVPPARWIQRGFPCCDYIIACLYLLVNKLMQNNFKIFYNYRGGGGPGPGRWRASQGTPEGDIRRNNVGRSVLSAPKIEKRLVAKTY